MFWNRKPKSPITKEDEEWIILSYDWFEKTFKLDLAKREIYLLTKGFLDFQYTGSEEDPIKLIATIAHELTHVKLLGEGRLDENDEYLTDLTASLFGFVVFLANGSINQMTTWSGTSHTGWRIAGGSGYLHYKVYAFLISYWIVKRKEENAKWLNYLNKEILSEVKKSVKYLKKKD